MKTERKIRPFHFIVIKADTAIHIGKTYAQKYANKTVMVLRICEESFFIYVLSMDKIELISVFCNELFQFACSFCFSEDNFGFDFRCMECDGLVASYSDM